MLYLVHDSTARVAHVLARHMGLVVVRRSGPRRGVLDHLLREISCVQWCGEATQLHIEGVLSNDTTKLIIKQGHVDGKMRAYIVCMCARVCAEGQLTFFLLVAASSFSC